MHRLDKEANEESRSTLYQNENAALAEKVDEWPMADISEADSEEEEGSSVNEESK